MVIQKCLSLLHDYLGPSKTLEINQSILGTVEARVTCFYRRNEIPPSLIPLADKHHWGELAEIETDSDEEEDTEEKKQVDR